ncbi:hypothetical protein LguiB_024809 [Lonicera macranthoides]
MRPPNEDHHHNHVFSPPMPHYLSPPQHYHNAMFPPPPPPPPLPHYHHGAYDPQMITRNEYVVIDHPWSSGLFDCLDDVNNCCKTFWCPCITFGQIAEILNEGQTPWFEQGLVCGIFAWMGVVAALPIFTCHTSFPYSCWYRAKMRKKFKLRGSYLSDCVIHCFCECCAICQEYRQLDHQGFDVPLGWHENNERHRQAVAVYRVVPVMEQGMRR